MVKAKQIKFFPSNLSNKTVMPANANKINYDVLGFNEYINCFADLRIHVHAVFTQILKNPQNFSEDKIVEQTKKMHVSNVMEACVSRCKKVKWAVSLYFVLAENDIFLDKHDGGIFSRIVNVSSSSIMNEVKNMKQWQMERKEQEEAARILCSIIK